MVPLIFCLSSAWMVWSSVTYANWLTLIAVIPLACGLPLYLFSKRIPASRLD